MYYCEEKGMGIVTMRSLTSGIFQKWMRIIQPDNTFDYSKALIQYVLSNPLVDTALLGIDQAIELSILTFSRKTKILYKTFLFGTAHLFYHAAGL